MLLLLIIFFVDVKIEVLFNFYSSISIVLTNSIAFSVHFYWVCKLKSNNRENLLTRYVN